MTNEREQPQQDRAPQGEDGEDPIEMPSTVGWGSGVSKAYAIAAVRLDRQRRAKSQGGAVWQHAFDEAQEALDRLATAEALLREVSAPEELQYRIDAFLAKPLAADGSGC